MKRDRRGVLLVTGGRTHQENYAAMFAADPRCRLVGLTDEADVSADRKRWNAQLADSLGVPLLPDLDAALARDDVEIVSVCSEPERRARIAWRAVEAGKHVYVDKPLGSDLAQVDALVAAAARRRVKTQMFSMLRAPWVQRTREVVDSGRIGTLVGLHADLLFAKGTAGTAPTIGPRREQAPPGQFTFVDSKREVYTTAIYSLVHMMWLTGRSIVAVRAVTGNYFFAEHARNDCEDFGALLVRLDGDLEASLTAGRIGWTSHPEGGPMRMTLAGTRGSVTIDAYRPRLEISNDEPPWTPPRRNPDDPMGFWSSTTAAAGVRPKTNWQTLDAGGKSDASFFVDCIEQDRESDLPVARAAQATEAILAGYRSAAEGAWVTLPIDRDPWATG